MLGCMRCLFRVSVLSTVDDCQLSPCVDKQPAAPTGKQRIVLLNATNSRHILATLRKAHLKNNIHPLKFTLYFEHFWCSMFPADSSFLWHYYFLNHTASVFLHKRCCACCTSSPHTAPHHTITLQTMCYSYNTKYGKLYVTYDKQIGSPQDRIELFKYQYFREHFSFCCSHQC